MLTIQPRELSAWGLECKKMKSSSLTLDRRLLLLPALLQGIFEMGSGAKRLKLS
jgi:hypothetical protein